jgi:PAS domain S-box-containing protein
MARIFLYFHLPQPFSVFALSAIAVTFWYSGTRPGILAVLLAIIVRNSYEPRIGAAPLALYDLSFVIFALLMTMVTRARKDLEASVAERTADLTRANQDLRLEIAERKQAEYLTGQVFDSSPDGVCIIGRDYRYKRVNPSYGRSWDRPAEKIVGMHVADLLGTDMFEETIKPNLDRCFSGEEEVSYGYWFTQPPSRRYMAISYSPLRRGSELVEAALVISRDLTEHIMATEQLRQTQADLARISRVTTMGELTASLAHEVNQPIAAAITNANTCVRWLTRNPPDVEEARETALRMVKDATRAAEIISRVRLLFKKGTAPREMVDINDVIREMIILLRSEANQHSVVIRAEFGADLPSVVGDRVQLQQVLMNLMLNGVEAMKDVNGERELAVKSALKDGHLLISVSDTGVGLSSQHSDQIFNAFFTTKDHGTGMGLSISRSILESHGGRLWAAANSPRGASFCFTLPIDHEG